MILCSPFNGLDTLIKPLKTFHVSFGGVSEPFSVDLALILKVRFMSRVYYIKIYFISPTCVDEILVPRYYLPICSRINALGPFIQGGNGFPMPLCFMVHGSYHGMKLVQ